MNNENNRRNKGESLGTLIIFPPIFAAANCHVATCFRCRLLYKVSVFESSSCKLNCFYQRQQKRVWRKGKTNIKLLQNNTANVINVPYAQTAIRHHRSVHKHELPSYLFSGSECLKFNFLKFLFNLTFCYVQQKVAANQLM